MSTTSIAVRGPIPHQATDPGPIRRAAHALRDESGAATAEYAIATLAAVGFAGLLVVILRGDEIKGMLTDIIHRALSISI
jgi:Flp pilus assembly pilin Flp